MTEYWYRCEDYRTAAPLDEFDNPVGQGSLHVKMRRLKVLKHTPKGVWLDDYGNRKWVSKDAKKQFACPTLEAAKHSFIMRKKRQCQILQARLKTATEALKAEEEEDAGRVDEITTVPTVRRGH